MLDAAPCRGYDGTNDNVEWGWTDRLSGDRNVGNSGNSTSNSRVDYMFYYNLYNLASNISGDYSPIPIKQLAPYNLLKDNYTEYDKKNFIAANSITANSYFITSDPTEGQGRVTFAAGQKITLSNGFKVTNGGYFHGYIDPSIGAMNCSDPPSQTDCSGEERLVFAGLDTITDADSVIVMNSPDSLTTTLCSGDTLYPHAKYLDSIATSFYWDFGNGQTSTLENPSIYYSSSGYYLLTLIITSPSKTDTFSMHIIVPDCNNIRTNKQNQQTNNNTNNLKTGIKIIPNPSNGIFTLFTQEDGLKEIFIYNSICVLVDHQIINSTIQQIDLSSQPKGIYFIKVQTSVEIYTDKIIVQ